MYDWNGKFVWFSIENSKCFYFNLFHFQPKFWNFGSFLISFISFFGISAETKIASFGRTLIILPGQVVIEGQWRQKYSIEMKVWDSSVY